MFFQIFRIWDVGLSDTHFLYSDFETSRETQLKKKKTGFTRFLFFIFRRPKFEVRSFDVRISPRAPLSRLHVYSRLYLPLNTFILTLGYSEACIFSFLF